MELLDFTGAKEGPVRLTIALKKLLAVTLIFVRGVEFVDGGLLVDVAPR